MNHTSLVSQTACEILDVEMVALTSDLNSLLIAT